MITPVGFGSWAIGGSGWQFAWGSQDDRASVAAIHRALERGINWIDTAAAYGLGHAEAIVARALAEWPGRRPHVFTKCALRWDGQGRVSRKMSAASIRRECEDSLGRLKVEAIDLYQVHWPVENGPELEEGWGAMQELRREGKIRWAGVSNFNIQQMDRARAIGPIAALQPPFSLVRREAEADVLPYGQRHGIGAIIYSPMASGLLSGAMSPERIRSLPDDDWRKRAPDFAAPKLAGHLRLVERLRAIGRRHGCTAGAVAIAWTLRHPAVTGAIVGARRPEQVDEVAAAASIRLTNADLDEMMREDGALP